MRRLLRGVSLIDTRGLHVIKTRSKLCSHLPLALSSILLGPRTWAIFAMDHPVISASQSLIFYLFVRKFTIVGVIFYHSIFPLDGFDFRTCLQFMQLCRARSNTAKESLKELAMTLNLTVNLTQNQTPN